jgi:hypothetical protein
VSSCRSSERRDSRTPLTVEPAVLDGFGAVLGGQPFGPGEIGDRAGDLEDAVVTAGREPELGHRRREQSLGLGGDPAEASHLPRAHRGIDADRAGAEAVALTLAGDIHSHPDRLAGLPRGHALNVGGRQRGELDV